MPRAKALALFVLRLAIIDALLLTPWFGAGSAYRCVFVAEGSLVFRWFGTHRTVQFHSTPVAADALDVKMTLVNFATGERATMPLSSRYFGFMPTAFVLALVLATPLPWKRRLLMAITAVACVNVVVLLRVLVAIVVNFSPADHPGLISLSAALKSVLVQIEAAVSVPLVGWFFIPLVIWAALISGRREVWLLPTSIPNRANGFQEV